MSCVCSLDIAGATPPRAGQGLFAHSDHIRSPWAPFAFLKEGSMFEELSATLSETSKISCPAACLVREIVQNRRDHVYDRLCD